MSRSLPGLSRFDEFELDRPQLTLRRNGAVVPLHAKAFQVLAYLVANPGRVVTKEELMQAVWPGAAVADSNLPAHISALRKALADRAGCIVTVPGRGYQLASLVSDPALDDVVVETVRERATIVTQEPVFAPADRHAGKALWLWLALALLVLLAGAIATYRWLHPRTYGHAEAIIADLQNDTGDKDFDYTLNKVLQIDLQQSPYFTVVSDGRARRTLKMMGHPASERITGPIAREICQRVNGQVYLVPSIARLGAAYDVALQAFDCGDGHALGSGHQSVPAKREVLAAFSMLTSKIRRGAGETRSSLKEFNKPLYDEPTSSLEALRVYSEATRLGDGGKFAESIAMYQHAIELDPNFAVAFADMSTMYYNMDDQTHDKQAISKAYELRGTVNERERFYIELRYHQSVTGDLYALLDALRRWAGLYPEDNLPLADLVNFETWTGQYPEAAADADRVLAIERRNQIHNGISYEISARAYHHANLPDKLRAVYAEAEQWKVETQGLQGVMLEFAAERGDHDEVARLLAASRGTPAETHTLQEVASVELAEGHVAKAEALFAEAHVAARRDRVEESLADLDDYHVRMLFELGMTAQARALLKTLPAADPSLDKAFAEAAVGDKAKAIAEAERQQATAPMDTLMNAEYVPSVRAIIAIQAGKPQEAVALLANSAPFELRDPTVPYLRGQAFLAANQPAQAAAEFGKLADHPWLADPAAPLIALSHLGLARANAMQGNHAESRREYEALFHRWKDADADIPILKQAHAEYGRMHD